MIFHRGFFFLSYCNFILLRKFTEINEKIAHSKIKPHRIKYKQVMESKAQMLYSLILAGGKGTRLYPLSRGQEPKQFLKIVNDKSFLVNTVDRVSPLIPSENIYVITNKDYEERLQQELPELNPDNIFVEPANKETATCIGLAAMKLLKKDKDAVMVVLPSDHYIENNHGYIETLKQAVEIADKKNVIVTIGIEPTRPEMGYGYIEMGERMTGEIPTYKVNRFTEKPNLEVAKDFMLKGTYLWNSGMFIMRADTLITKLRYFRSSNFARSFFILFKSFFC